MFDHSVLALLAIIGTSRVSATSLPAYNVNAGLVSVSGLSSGGFMAAQLGVAYSDIFNLGFGVFAGGPYDCARDQSYTFCMNDAIPSISIPIANMQAWSGNEIASISNLLQRKVYMWVGSLDAVAGANVMDQLSAQMATFVDEANISYIETIGAAHTFPTDFDSSGDNLCGLSESPYISNCAYDGAGAALQWIYGSLNARNTGTLSGSFISFDQSGSFGASGMDSTGYLYVPKSCQNGATACSLHVALHGCLQGYSVVGSQFIENTGYNQWADTNNMIILYPQAIQDYTVDLTWSGGFLSNPNGCWDWIGWYGDNADQIGGVQMTAIVNQVNQIMSG